MPQSYLDMVTERKSILLLEIEPVIQPVASCFTG
jgi:hypothetical protein